MTATDEIDVSDHPDAHRYEIRVDGRLVGFAAYREQGTDRRIFTHTEIDRSQSGHGLGGRLIGAALDDMVARGRTVVPLCPFVVAYLRDHPGYLDIVDPRYRADLAADASS